MSIVTALQVQAKKIEALEEAHAKALWSAHKAWMLVAVAMLVGGFILGRLA